MKEDSEQEERIRDVCPEDSMQSFCNTTLIELTDSSGGGEMLQPETTSNILLRSPFGTTGGVPPPQILQAFGTDPMHCFVILGEWDLKRAALARESLLVHSKQLATTLEEGTNWEKEHARGKVIETWSGKKVRISPEFHDLQTQLVFRHFPKVFVLVNVRLLVVYATKMDEAERLAMEFVKDFTAEEPTPKPEKTGKYVLIKQSNRGDLDSHEVELSPSMRLNEEQIDLHYGADLRNWQSRFMDQLRNRNHGLSILEGPPGTGKTTFLRHLLCMLEDTHRFYFIAPANLNFLSRPDFIDFWTNQAKTNPNKKFVVIVEDAEEALMERGTDNSRIVSTILNLTDGILADFLKLHIICTVNCSTAKMDSALLRPGRLLARRVFRKLTIEEATRLADSLGKSLKVSNEYSLAEIFAVDEDDSLVALDTIRAKVGFSTT